MNYTKRCPPKIRYDGVYLYRHIRLDINLPFYVGIGVGYRAYQKYKRSAYWNRVAEKAGYDVEIIMDGLTWEEAEEKEKEFIALYGRRDKGLGTLANLTDGGGGMLGWVCPEYIKAKLSVERKGQLCSNKGYRHSDDIKEIMSAKSKGNKRCLGRILSSDTKEKLRAKGLIQKRGSVSKPVLYCDANGNVINEYFSVKEAARQTNNFPQSIMGLIKRASFRQIHKTNYWKFK